MDNLDLSQVSQPIEQLNGDLSQQVLVHSSEARLLDIFVQVDVKKLKHDDIVSSEVKAVIHLDNAILVRILTIDPLQKLRFDTRIISLLLFVLANFHSY